MEVYQGARRSYDPLQNVLNLHVDDLHALAGSFTSTLRLGHEDGTVGGNTRINAPISLGGKTITGLQLFAPLTLSVNQPITMGAVGVGAAKQSLDLRGREIELNANVGGVGELYIRPGSNGQQPVNPLVRGMLVGAAADDSNRLTITETEYNRIGNTFSRIYFGRSDMQGDLEIAGFSGATAFKLRADTDLIANSTVKLNVATGGSFVPDPADATKTLLKRLWVRGLELDITQEVTDLSMLAVNFNDPLIGLNRKFVLNRADSDTKPAPGVAMDLNASDLGRIKGSVALLNIGWSGQVSYGAIEVLNEWALPTHTELRSLSRTLADPNVTHYGSITVGGKIDGNSKNLTFASDSTLSLEGVSGSITNVANLGIVTPSNGVPIRLLEPGKTTGNPESLTVSASSYAALGANITNLTVGRSDGTADVTVFGAMNLVANTTLVTGTGNISVLGAVDSIDDFSAKDLTLNTARITSIGASLGEKHALSSLSIVRRTSDPTIEYTLIGSVGGGLIKVKTTGNQTWSERVDLLAATRMEAGGTLTIAETLGAGANDLTLLGNEMTFGAASLRITGTGILTLGAGTVGTNVAFYSASNTDVASQLDLTQTKMDKFTLGSFSQLIIGRDNGTGTVSVKENFGLFQETLIQTGGGAINIEKQIDTSAAVSGAQKLTLSSGAGNITATGAMGSSLALGDLVVNSTGTATLRGLVKAASMRTDAGGSTVLNDGRVTTTGRQTYNDNIVLGAATTLTSSGAGVTGDIEVNAGATGAFALNVNTSGVTRLKGEINVGSVETNEGGSVELAANITTTGTQNYREQAVLSGDTLLSGTAVTFDEALGGGGFGIQVLGNAAFKKTVASLSGLRAAGDAVFGGTVGGAGSLDVGVVTVDGTTQINGGTVKTTGAQRYVGGVTLGRSTGLEGSLVSFGSTVAGGTHSLDVTGNAEFNGKVSGLSALGVTGTTLLNTDEVTTSGAQTYGGKVTLGQDVVLRSTGGGDVSINGGAAGDKALAINTGGATKLAGGISVGSITTDAGGTVELSGEITTSGNVTVTGDSGTSGALQGFGAKGARVEVGGVQASGDVTLDASDLLVLQGASYKAGDTLSLNPTARATASGRSSIVKPSGDVSLEAVKFVMGAGQKLVVSNGALSITAANGVVGDLAASVAMDLNVDRLEVLSRDAGDFTNAGLKDLGLSIVSSKITFNGTLAYSPDSTGAKKVVWNTANGAVSGRSNITKLSGSGVGKNAKMSEQFNSVDAEGYVLQPLAVRPPVVVPPEVIDPATPLPTPSEPLPTPSEGFRFTQFDLMNWNLGYRDETLERPDGVWVFRSLGVNGRWDTLPLILSGQRSAPKAFVEL